MNFDEKKASIFKRADLSPKGSIDAPIRSLVDAMFKHPDLCPTSSCSGRIVLFERSLKRKGGSWLIAEHGTVSASQVEAAIDDYSNDGDVVFKHEPFVMHVFVRSLEVASNLLKLSVSAGFRESGMAVSKEGFVVGVRTSSNTLEAPTVVKGSRLVDSTYLKALVEHANSRFEDNAARVSKLEELFRFEMLNVVSFCEFENLRRWGHACAGGALVGGFGAGAGSGKQTRLKSCVSLPDLPKALYRAAMVDVKGVKVVIGGRDSPFKPNSKVYYCMNDDDVWRECEQEYGGFWSHTATVVGELVLVAGGRTLDFARDAADFLAFELVNGALSFEVKRTLKLPSPVFSHAALKVDSKSVLLHGGLADLSGSTLREFVWVSESARVCGESELWRFSHALIKLNDDDVCIVGGVSNSLRSVEVWDLENERHSVHENVLPMDSLPVRAAFEDGVLKGGGAVCFAFGSVFSQNVKLNLSNLPNEQLCFGVFLNSKSDIQKCAQSLPKRLRKTKRRVDSKANFYPIRDEGFESVRVSEMLVKGGVSEFKLCFARPAVDDDDDDLKIFSKVGSVLFVEDSGVSYERLSRLAVEHDASHVLLKPERISGSKRTPVRTRILFPKNAISAWTCVKQYGVEQHFDASKTMFSKGNANEKKRIRSLVAPHEVVADLFAGIGYFALQILAAHDSVKVHACEWAPETVRALRRNLLKNNFQHRCEVHVGDCNESVFGFSDSCDRVHLGLIPSSREGYASAVKALKLQGGVMHVHAVCEKINADEEGSRVAKEVSEMWLKVRRRQTVVVLDKVTFVKSYAPRLFHVVFDLNVGGGSSPARVPNLKTYSTDDDVVLNAYSKPKQAESALRLLRRAVDELKCVDDDGKLLEKEWKELFLKKANEWVCS